MLSPGWANNTDVYFDWSNATGCAADTNSGTAPTCDGLGGGPLLTWAENMNRLGPPPIRLPQTVTYHVLSDAVSNPGADPIYFSAATESTAMGSRVIFRGDGLGDFVCGGTLGAVTSKSRSPAPGNLLSVASISNCGPPNLGLGYKIYNTTRGNSVAWIEEVSLAHYGPWNITQPFAPVTTIPPNSLTVTPAEIDTWAAGDSVSVYTPYAIRFATLAPQIERTTGSFVPWVIYNLSNGTNPGEFNNFAYPTHVSGATMWIESASLRFLTLDAAGGSETRTAFINSVTDDIWGGKLAALGQNSGTNALAVIGGMFGPATLWCSPQTFFDGDFVFAGGNNNLFGACQFGQVALITAASSNYGAGLNIWGSVLEVAKSYGGPNLYGPGKFNVTDSGRISYPGLTATSWLSIANWTINNQSFACNGGPATAFGSSLTPACGLPLSAANLSAPTTQTLSGTVNITNGLAAIVFSTNQTLSQGQPIMFGDQTGVVYYLAAPVTASTLGTLTVPYSGVSDLAATVTTTNTGFGDAAWVPGGGSIGAFGP